jgi:hypothetical protein
MVTDQVQPLNEHVEEVCFHGSIKLVLLVFVHDLPFFTQLMELVDNGIAALHLYLGMSLDVIDFGLNFFEKFEDLIRVSPESK